MTAIRGKRDDDPIPLGHGDRKSVFEGASVPGPRLGGAAQVKVHQLMEEGLENVARADSRIGGNRKTELGGDGEAETVGARARSADLERRGSGRKRAAGEDRQPPEPPELQVQRHTRNQVVRHAQ